MKCMGIKSDSSSVFLFDDQRIFWIFRYYPHMVSSDIFHEGM